LGWPDNDSLPITLATLMDRIIQEEPIYPNDGILNHAEGVDLLPANMELSGMEVALVGAMSREFTLRSYLDSAKDSYEYILVDCMPSLGMLTINALAAADKVIVPVQAQYLLTRRESLAQDMEN
jgi:chromosome partitioning protein